MTHASPAPSRALAVTLVLASTCGLLAGFASLPLSSWLRIGLDLSPMGLIAAAAVLVGLFLMVRRPEAGLHLLLIAVGSNLSDVLVRQGLPSLLHLLVPTLLLVLTWARLRESGGHRGAGLRPVLPFVAASSLYAAWVFLSTCWAAEPGMARGPAAELFKAVLLAVVVACFIDRPALLRRASLTLVSTGALLAALSSFQVMTHRWEETFLGLARVKHAHIAGHVFRPRTTGPLSDPNYYAQLLLPLVPLALALALTHPTKWLRRLAAVAAALIALGVVTTYSRGGVLALGLALVLMLVVERRRIALRHAMLATALGLALLPLLPQTLWNRLGTLQVLLPREEEGLEPHDSSVNKRKLVMAAAALMALDNPVLGVGIGNYTTHFDTYVDQVGEVGRVYNLMAERAYPHCLYLEILAETGLIGLLLFGLAAGLALLMTLRASARFASTGDESGALLARALAIGWVAVMISSLLLHGDYPRHLWLLLGLCAAAAASARLAGWTDLARP